MKERDLKGTFTFNTAPETYAQLDGSEYSNGIRRVEESGRDDVMELENTYLCYF